ncbi:hypothetical protein AIOL_000826 [Candidatus Rhodobacter oscarellae]|uniref:Uncharacterized protein n=1 Tax=Candidatus Rhodobacter oscarellae TaxID=1675527 RepID=A0A0J9ED03_9RHOB|nr:hypothetical protein AIOL_000826 [Candidatus Rhodobacter lobularis]
MNAPVALAYAQGLTQGQRVKVDFARKMHDAGVSIGPLYDPKGERMRA